MHFSFLSGYTWSADWFHYDTVSWMYLRCRFGNKNIPVTLVTPNILTPLLSSDSSIQYGNDVKVVGKQCRPRSDCSKEQSDQGLHCLFRCVMVRQTSARIFTVDT